LGSPFCIAQPSVDFALSQQGFQHFLVDEFAFPLPQPHVIHGHDLEKNLAVTLGVVRHRHQQPDQAGTHQHQRFAPPPLANARQVWLDPAPAIRSLYDSAETRATGNCCSMKLRLFMVGLFDQLMFSVGTNSNSAKRRWIKPSDTGSQ
jgi:hypothetical protein